MEGYKTRDPCNWSHLDVLNWLTAQELDDLGSNFKTNDIDGVALLMLTEQDIREGLKIGSIGKVKKLLILIEKLKQSSSFISPLSACLVQNNPQIHHHCACNPNTNLRPTYLNASLNSSIGSSSARKRNYSSDSQTELGESPSLLKGSTSGGQRRPSGVATQLKAEYVKTIISCLYMFLVTWITAIVMVFVHDRVPDRVSLFCFYRMIILFSNKLSGNLFIKSYSEIKENFYSDYFIF